MKNRIAPLLAALALMIGGLVATAPAASAATTSCSTLNAHLRMDLTITNYSDGRSITAKLTGYYFQDVSLGRDITWRFESVTSPQLQDRTTNPTTWGGSAGNRLPNKSYEFTGHWHGTVSQGAAAYYTASCTKYISNVI